MVVKHIRLAPLDYPVNMLTKIASMLNFDLCAAIVRARWELMESRRELAGVRACTHEIVTKKDAQLLRSLRSQKDHDKTAFQCGYCRAHVWDCDCVD